MALSKSFQKGQVPLVCQMCEESNRLSWKCLHCDFLLCTKCHRNFTKKVKSIDQHTIIDIKDIACHQQQTKDTTDFRNIQCGIHAGQTCFLFCQSCEVVVCPLYSNYESEKQKILSREKDLKNEVEKHTNKLLKELDQRKEIVMKSVNDAENRSENIDKDLDLQKKTLSQALNSNNAKLVFNIQSEEKTLRQKRIVPVNTIFPKLPKFVPVIAKCGNEIKNLCKNHLYEYEDQETWNDVLHDVLEGENFPFHKTDTITTCVSDKLTGTATFKPDMEEPIRIVKEFDRTLKYVTFTINRDKDVGLTNPDSRKTTSTTQSAFTVMMNSCNSKKDPKHKDIKAANFTGSDEHDVESCMLLIKELRMIMRSTVYKGHGDVLHGKVFVRLQLSCSSHIEFAFYASNIGRVDLCAHCASPETNKDQELLKI
ncbi:unnamed protein product [Mytilus edulis]|uniref:B box-type domain-containing protein n=1 Tax=Mytilus edulis TaxID=6550 RepID=A0A8S3UUB0_MYTED|nr:unnamed protein product [Mytilus edulis]